MSAASPFDMDEMVHLPTAGATRINTQKALPVNLGAGHKSNACNTSANPLKSLEPLQKLE